MVLHFLERLKPNTWAVPPRQRNSFDGPHLRYGTVDGREVDVLGLQVRVREGRPHAALALEVEGREVAVPREPVQDDLG